MGKGATADILVIGAGIFGLAAALACAGRGLSVIVADQAEPGAGASGGPVGALSPHPPERWSVKRAFQLETLLAAEGYWARVAALGGLDPGFGRVGRVIPLATPAARALAEARAAEARGLWRGALWQVRDAAPPWLAPGAAPEGVVWETLSARLNPRNAIRALSAAVRARGGEIRSGWRARAIAADGAAFDQGRVGAGAVVIAAGMGGFDLMAPVLGRLGKGVKGQAALLAGGVPGRPMLYADGLYVVPHADGTVAVGATSEADWTGEATDAALEALIERARALCPDLGSVLARWAGVRPRGPRPDPMVGPLPGFDRVFVANGGFRTGFGLAPAVGAAVAALVAGETPVLPPGFLLTDHLAARRDI